MLPIAEYGRDAFMEKWTEREIDLSEYMGYYVTCTALELFFAGMDKKDLQEMIERNPADKEEILKLRTRAGEYFTSLDITVNKAALILMNIGEKGLCERESGTLGRLCTSSAQ
jgi:CBS domain containing-hemolysin-like protein